MGQPLSESQLTKINIKSFINLIFNYNSHFSPTILSPKIYLMYFVLVFIMIKEKDEWLIKFRTPSLMQRTNGGKRGIYRFTNTLDTIES